jgi:hypothetical protein
MSLYTEITARSHLATDSKNSCPRCSEWMLAPTRSEYLSEHGARNVWSCEACGCEFETTVLFVTGN